MTQDEAILRLAHSTAEAVKDLLEMFAPGQVTHGEASVVGPDEDPLGQIAAPALGTSVSYVDGVTGGNVFVITLEGARRLAAAMMGMDPGDAPADGVELDEMEISAVAEAMNQMMASAAGATSSVLGTEVEISPPENRNFNSSEQALGAYPKTPHATRVAFSVCGEPCRLVQLLPNAFIVRMTSALDELGAEYSGGSEPIDTPDAPVGRLSLDGMPVRVWAELGRTRLASADVVTMPTGAVVELDRQADEPVDLYINGRAFATGRLMVVDGTEWAVRIETVFNVPNSNF